uniref:Calx-beta domain-containing protein n=2 Tax=Amphimedon queenslandica TaxID=400682 RepID=A0A1X7TNB9_AMPQE
MEKILVLLLLSICCINAATVMFDPATYSVTEGDSNVTLNISFVTSEPLSAESTVRISSIPTAGATDEATSGVDYVTFNETVTLPAGSTRYDYAITILSNPEAEFPEQFSASLEFVSGNSLTVNGSSATVTINDTDVPTLVRFDPVTYNVTEAPVWISISFVTSQPLLGNSIVRLYDIPTAGTTHQATAGTDYSSFNSTVTLRAGDTKRVYTVYIYNDKEAEFPEQFSAALEFVSGWPLTVTGPNATVTINDTDVSTIRFSPSYNYITSEETTNANVTLTGVTSQPLLGETIIRLTDVPTPGATYPATRNIDYIAFNEEITLPAGSTGFSYNVTILPSTVSEYTEMFKAKMSYISGSPIVTESDATIQIYDNSRILLTFSSPEYIVSESNRSVTITITSAQPVLNDVVIILTDVPTSGGARNGTDYISFTATITIPSGQSSVSHTISLVDDDVPESTESFDVRICSISGYYVTSYSYTVVVTIIDDDSTGSTNAALVLSGLSISFNIILILILIAVLSYRCKKSVINNVPPPVPTATTQANNMMYDRNLPIGYYQLMAT